MAKNIIIVGGGFAGLNLAKSLSKSGNHQITVVDQNNYHFFPPLLYQVATAFIEAYNISYPFRKMFSERGVRFFMGDLIEVLPEQKILRTSNGDLAYDVLVLAMGTETNYFGNEQIKNNALPMKSIDDAIELRNHILIQLEKAARSSDPVERAKYSNVVIAGGGPTGVELAGMLAEMAGHIGKKDYPEFSNVSGKIFLIDAAPTLLSPMSEKSQNEALHVLKKLGVQVILGKLVKGFDSEVVQLADGTEIPATTLIWASGVIARKVPGLPSEVVGRGGRILVNEHNLVQRQQDIYCIGDQCLQQSDSAFPAGHPQVAQVAIQQGGALADNLKNMDSGRAPKNFVYNDKGSMAIISKYNAVVDLKRVFFRGIFAWWIWLFIHIIPIAGYRNKVKLFFSWAWSFVTNNPTLRLIIRYKGR